MTSAPLTAPVAASVRDPLGSDVDDRLVVWTATPDPAVERTSWPVARHTRRLPVGWPIGLAVAGWPLWWALGVTNVVLPLLAVPLAWHLVRQGGVRVPPAFWVWALFLGLVAVSGVAIDVDVSGTATPEGLGRYLAFVLRLLNYLAVTVVLLFLGNTSERDLPRARVIAWTCWLGVSCVLLGLLALVLPDGQFSTLATRVLPGGLLDDGAAVARLAQVQPVLGDPSPRPAAPFAYTNAWGHTLALLVVWLVAWWGAVGGGARRWALAVLLSLAAWPIVFSLNRGMWMGLGLAVVLVAVRLALRGRVRALVGVLLATSIGAVAFVSSPLQDVVTARFDAQHSNDVRGSLLQTALDSAAQSPVVGFGTTRRTLGSGASIAVGPSEACPRCGSRTIGSTGQVTLLLISQGFLGAALYFAFLGAAIWRFARDHSVLGLAGTTVVVLEIFFSFFYSALTVPLLITFVSIGLLWRNDQLRREARPA